MRLVTKSTAKKKFLSLDKKKLGLANAIHPKRKTKVNIILHGDKPVIMIIDDEFWM